MDLVKIRRGKTKNLRGAVLRGANLQGANLKGANLQGANLQDANLQDADLQYADLRGAILRFVDLRGADLKGANLQDADLEGADLRDADLRDADLQDADLDDIEVNFRTTGIHPAPEGDLIGWKKCMNGVIVKLRIPAEARRSCATTRKHRAEFVDVLEVYGAEYGSTVRRGKVHFYAKGERTYPDAFDCDRWAECSNGIHFFLSREEAEMYDGS